MTKLIFVFMLAWALSFDAGAVGFGGGRSSGGSFSSGGRSSSFGGARSAPSAPSVSASRSSGGSYFGGSRSAGSSTTITRPAPRSPAAAAAPSSGPSRTVIHESHHYGPSGGGSNDGFLTGLLFGSVMNHRPAPTVVVAGQPAAAVGAAPPPVAVAEPADEGHGFFWFIGRVISWTIILGALGALGYFIWFRFIKKEF